MNLFVFSVAFQVEAEKSVLILQVRSRIEELEKRFLKPWMLNSWTRYEKWDVILRGNIDRLRRKAELRRFRSTVTVDVEELIEVICDLYGEFSDLAARNVHYNVNYDETSVIEMLNKCKITPRSKIDAVLIILKPIP